MIYRKAIPFLVLMAFVLCGQYKSETQTAGSGAYSIQGYLHVSGQPPQSMKAKLYFPGGEQVLFSSPDRENNFRFASLPASSFLLEIYVNDNLYYQREIETLQSNILLAIPVGNYQLVSKCLLDERTNKRLDDSEFQGKVSLAVGDIDDDLRPNEEPLTLTIRQESRTLAKNSLTPPKLISLFAYGNNKYTLAGLVRKIGQISKLDCEIYRMRS